MPTANVSHTPLDRAALREVARLHQQALPLAFLSSLGIGLLTEFYEGIQRYPGGILLTAQVVQTPQEIVGFVAGVDDVAAFHRWLTRKHFPLATWRLLPSLARMTCSPRVWKKMCELIFYPRRANRLAVALPAAELLSLGVLAEFRRQGVACLLYTQLVEHFRLRGVKAFRILVGGKLPAAHEFYLAQGASEVARFELHAGGETVVYVQPVPCAVSTLQDSAFPS